MLSLCVSFLLLLLLNFVLIKSNNCLSNNKILFDKRKSLYLILINMIIIYYGFSNANKIDSYIINIFTIILVIVLIYDIVKLDNKYKDIKEKNEKIENVLNNYEKTIDNFRIERHELLNNLILLNSFPKKEFADYKCYLNKLIKQYSGDNLQLIKDISSLPSGLKGIIYFKFNCIEQDKIKLFLFCEKQIEKTLLQYSKKDYTKFCQLIEIFLDNSIDAAKESKEKRIIIDIYKTNKKIIVYIENSIDQKVDINKFENKYTTTKKNHHGLGLFIAHTIIKKSSNIIYKQYSDNDKFITEVEYHLNK